MTTEMETRFQTYSAVERATEKLAQAKLQASTARKGWRGRALALWLDVRDEADRQIAAMEQTKAEAPPENVTELPLKEAQ